jgi:hypothetical protein
MKTVRLLLCCAWVGVCLAVPAVPAEDKKPEGKGIDPATVAAYEKLGAAYGGWVRDHDGFRQFEKGRQAAEKGLPGFLFTKEPKAALPVVSVPFGLEFCEMADGGLTEVAGLKSLTLLQLGGTEVTDVGLKELASLNSLTELRLRHTKVKGAGFKELAGLKNLITLALDFEQLTDTSLRTLRESGLLYALLQAKGKNAERPLSAEGVLELDLSSTQVTDAGLKELSCRLNNLTVLGLWDTQVTDAGLTSLADLKSLTKLVLERTQVTAKGVTELRKALPKCEISR